jgi:4'-phosphopantetheinyl transferase
MTHIDLYTFKIDPASRVERFLLNCLDSAERERASSFKIAKLARLAIIARGVLRHILAPRAGVSPAEVEFSYNEYGKPFLRKGRDGAEPASFNLSHSEDFLAIAVGEGARIGVDIECPREIDGLDALSGRFLTAAEREMLSGLPERRRSDSFLRLWTWKEAAIKASGVGLSLDPARVEVGAESVALDLPEALASRGFADRLYVSDIPAAGLFHGAVASDCPGARIRLLADCQDPGAFLGLEGSGPSG